jgi:poly(3-hydroxyoctanoate) depolymerase
VKTDTELVTVAGQRLRVAVSGSGRPLLLLNGIGGSLELWEPLVEKLDAEVIRFDAPGTGGSPVRKRPMSIPALANLTARLLDTLGYQEVDVLGMSLGGLTAEQLAISHPDRVRRLVLAVTNFGVGSFPGKLRAWRILVSPARYYIPGYYETHIRDFVGGRTGRDPDAAEAYAIMRRMHPPQPLGHLWQMTSAATWSTFPLLHRITAPTLVLAGDDDPLIPVINAGVLAWRIPNAQLHVVRGAGHLLVLDEADTVAPVIEDFLAQPASERGIATGTAD